jgi:hypothetical protein
MKSDVIFRQVVVRPASTDSHRLRFYKQGDVSKLVLDHNVQSRP